MSSRTRLLLRHQVVMIPLLAALVAGCQATATPIAGETGSVVRMVLFYRDDCSHCVAVIEEVLEPLQAEHDERLQVKMVQYHDPNQPGELDAARYEMLLRAEEVFGVAAGERGIPTLVIGAQVLIGEEEIREQLPCLLDTCLAGGGTAWPDIPGLDEIPVQGDGWPSVGPHSGTQDPAMCAAEEQTCDPGAAPIWATYFYQVGCPECHSAMSDIQYVQSKYPQLQVEESSILENWHLAERLAKRAGREKVRAPALFIGGDALIGSEEVTWESIEALVEKYSSTGAPRIGPDPEVAEPRRLPGALAVAFAGLVDGLNPCAFATLIFFISYLTVSERRGWEILAVGVAFTAGVFLAYFALGLGLYRVLETVQRQHTALRFWVNVLAAGFCILMAILSFLDFFKARRGQVKDMALVMPEGLRRRAHAVIRRSSSARAFVLVALATGAVVSLLELACTGQPLFAMIVSTISAGQSLAQAVLLLVLFCLMFVVPLVAVFVMVHFGATSLQLGILLRRQAAVVKLGTALLFAGFATWLVYSVVV